MQVSAEFFKFTKVVPLHPVNRLEDACARRDRIFSALAEKVFDNPRLLDLLAIKLRHWLKKEKSEFAYALAGYTYYLREDFLKAEEFFLRALNECPQNLDNWFDLAFALYHQDEKKHNLGKKILFNFDYCIKVFNKKRVDLETIEDRLKGL